MCSSGPKTTNQHQDPCHVPSTLYLPRPPAWQVDPEEPSGTQPRYKALCFPPACGLLLGISISSLAPERQPLPQAWLETILGSDCRSCRIDRTVTGRDGEDGESTARLHSEDSQRWGRRAGTESGRME